jgi:hypothetical protein
MEQGTLFEANEAEWVSGKVLGYMLVERYWCFEGSDDPEFAASWVDTKGYPAVAVGLHPGGTWIVASANPAARQAGIQEGAQWETVRTGDGSWTGAW